LIKFGKTDIYNSLIANNSNAGILAIGLKDEHVFIINNNINKNRYGI